MNVCIPINIKFQLLYLWNLLGLRFGVCIDSDTPTRTYLNSYLLTEVVSFPQFISITILLHKKEIQFTTTWVNAKVY